MAPEQAMAATLGTTDANRTQAESSGTGHVESSIIDTYEYNRWEYELSCGHTIIWEDSEPPRFCPNCGRRIEQ
jgi:rubrerythrin